MDQQINKKAIKQQILVCRKIIYYINKKNYHNSYILIKNFLNNNNYYWYKDINLIIDNQISNLFYDITNNTNLTVDFFKNTINKLEYLIKE